MAIIKCKMCGGDLALIQGQSVAECEYCGTRQTVPVADNDRKLTLFARANRLRSSCEFDKAAGIYEAIVTEFPQEAESYWGLVLCKYGIEYVDDPATGKKIPTCHRSSFDSVLDDSNFDQAMENADEEAQTLYRQEAKQIERIRRGILEVSSSEKPYDIFICYKETDSKGNRTVDSLLAQDIYDALTGKDYRVFFSRISLEDKLGQAYEPSIFAALNSAKIMLAVGTCYEHYNAVWVKNEWSRYLKIIAADKSKYLIPCYKGLDPNEDLPREFAHLQGQDMGKVGAIADLLRGIEKLMPRAERIPDRITGSVTTESLLKRAYMFLEDKIWNSANDCFEKVLDMDPENARAYLGKLLAELQISKAEALGTCTTDFTSSYNYQKARQFGDDSIRAVLDDAHKDRVYSAAKQLLQSTDYRKAAAQLTTITGWRDADDLLEHCQSRIWETEAEEAALKQQKKRTKSHRRFFAAVLVLAAAASLLLWKPDILKTVQLPSLKEDPEPGLKVQGSLEEEQTGEEAAVAELYKQAEQLADNREYGKAAIAFAQLDDYRDSRAKSLMMWRQVPGRHTISMTAGISAILRNGTVITPDGVLEAYKDVVSLANDILLLHDGTVRSYPSNTASRYVADWSDIVAISGHWWCQSYMGLKSDGTVVLANADPEVIQEVAGWTDIVAIANGADFFLGLKSDGTVVAAGCNDAGQCNVSGWTNIRQIAVSLEAGKYGVSFGLQEDGKVVAAGSDYNGSVTKAKQWNNVESLFNGPFAVNSWGTVLWGMHTTYSNTGIGAWKDIVDVVGHYDIQYGLKSDGTLAYSFTREDPVCITWTDIQVPQA